MKWSAFATVLTAGALVSGCASHKPKPSAAAPPPSVIVTPDVSLAAKVVIFNPTGRFVVLNFPMGQMPAIGQTFFLYRGGLKEGEVKISGPQNNDNDIVADLITGEAQVGDEVRSQ